MGTSIRNADIFDDRKLSKREEVSVEDGMMNGRSSWNLTSGVVLRLPAAETGH